MTKMRLAIVLGVTFWMLTVGGPGLVCAEVVRLEIQQRVPFADGYPFEHTGP